MKKIILTAIAVVTLASSASAWTSTTMRNIGSTTYINSYGSGGYSSSTTCRYIGSTVYCNTW